MKNTVAIARFLGIRAGEGRAVLLMWALSFCLGLSLVLTLTLGSALFIAQVGSQALPYIYLAGSVTVPLLGFIYLAIQKRFSFQTLQWVNVAGCLIAFVLLRAAFFLGDSHIAAAALLIWYDVLFWLVNVAFWPLASRIFDIRQSKRLYGLVGSGELMAGIVGGFSVPVALNWMRAEDLLYACVLAIAAAMLVMAMILRETRGNTAPAESQSEDESQSPAARRFVRLIIALSGIFYFTYFIVDKAFYDQTQQRMDDPAKLAAFLGVFFGVVESGKLVARLLVSGRFLKRFGAPAGLIVLPVILAFAAVTALGASVVPAMTGVLFWVVCGTKLMERVTRFAVDRPSLLVLYQALPPVSRTSTQTTAEGIFGPISGGLAALVLLLLNVVWPGIRALQILLGVLSMTWLWIAWKLGRGYAQVLSDVLSRERSKNRAKMTLDPSECAEVAGFLENAHPAVVLHAARLLEESEPAALERILPGLLDHQEPLVRGEALRLIEKLGLENAVKQVRRSLDKETDPTVRAAAIRAWAAVVRSEEISDILAYLRDDSAEARSAAAIGLLRRNDHNLSDEARRVPVEMSRNPEPSQRRAAAWVIQATGDAELQAVLTDLLQDDDPTVRNQAIAAVPAYSNPAHWSLLVKSLGEVESVHAGLDCLRDAGHHFMSYWEEAFHDPQIPTEVKVELVEIMDQFEGETVVHRLVSLFKLPNAAVRHVLLKALARRRKSLRGKIEGPARQVLEAEIRRGAWVLESRIEVADREEHNELTVALEAEFERIQQRLMWLLTLVQSSVQMSIARSLLLGGPQSFRAMALELIENLLPQHLKQHAFPLLEETSLHVAVERISRKLKTTPLSRRQCLKKIISRVSTDTVANRTRACAIREMIHAPNDELIDAAEESLSSHDPLVRETAVWALSRVAPDRLDACRQILDSEQDSLVLAALKDSMDNSQSGTVMLSTLDKIFLLKSVSLFEHSAHETLFDLCRHIEEVALSVGESVFAQGEEEASLYVVVSGSVRLHSGDITQGERRERELLGELSAFDGGPREVSATAMEKTVLLRIPAGPSRELIQREPQAAQAAINAFCRRVRNAT